MTDLAFQIQLGLVLPKMKQKLQSELMTIVEELVTVVQAGSTDGEEVTTASVKELVMKDFEIFVDQNIFPAIEAKLHPPVAEAASDASEDSGESVAEAA